MTLRALKMPRLGETMEEGRIAGWLVQPGSAFKRGDPLLEIETDKTVAEFPALGDGLLLDVSAAPGETVAVGTPIARIELHGEVDWTAEGEQGTDAKLPSGDVEPAGAAVPPGETTAASTRESPALADLAMPRLGETMEEGRIARWLKQPGESFARGEALLEIETDKTVAEFPALADGRLVEILRAEGETVAVDQPIARIEGSPVPARAEVGATPAAAHTVPARAEPASTARAAQFQGAGRVRATPASRQLARHHGLDIGTLRGTGRRGRVETADVRGAALPHSAERQGAPAPDLRFATLPEGRMAYLEAGPQEGAGFLLLHGFGGDRTTWAALASGLKRAGARVIAPDLPAHGLTEIEAGTAAALAAPLPALVGAAFGPAGRIEVVAHSLGAVAAVALARAAPERVRRLTLIAPAGIGPEIDDGFIRGLAHASAGSGVGHWLRRLTATPNEMSGPAMAALAAELAKGRLRSLAGDVAGPGGQQVDILSDLEALAPRIPVRVLVGLEDRIIPWTQATALPARVAVHFLARAGHMPQWDRPRDVLEILLSGSGEEQ